MKKGYYLLIMLLLFISSLSVHAQDEENDYDIGGQMLTYPKVDWLKGKAITQFHKDSIYIVELWATWCKPCVAAMPHLNTLSKKFKGKIIFIAQDVMENNKEKVVAFVKKHENIFDFRFAYSGGNGSDFNQQWTKPAGVFSIPATFVIINNKLVWQTRPNNLTEELLQSMVDGTFEERDDE